VAAELQAAGSEVLTVNADLTKPEDAQKVVDATLNAYGVPDVMVNNAAATFIGPFLDVPVSRWRTALNLNLLAPVALIQGFLPGMLQRGEGRVINITSSAARTHELPTGGVPQLCYGASKAGLDSLTYGLARDFAGMGVSFNLLAPVVFTNRSSTTSPTTGSPTSSNAWPRWDPTARRWPTSLINRWSSPPSTSRTTTWSGSVS
jgi:NAD(P)-dependent dehydrogenase (short-subunit alcohol dehydrogenase family)